MPTVQLFTEHGEQLHKVMAENPEFQPWDVYPRPQMVRESWINLNGWWEFCALTLEQTGRGETPPYDRRILVPFPVESALSGIGEHFPEISRLWYRKRFTLEEIPQGRCLLLHVGAADQWMTVRLNGKRLRLFNTVLNGTATLPLPDVQPGENTLELRVWDDLRDRSVPYGKQRKKRGGMWYTPVTGIWQTVWMEWVPETYISALKITPTLTSATIEVMETTVGNDHAPTKKPPLLAGEGDRAAVEGLCSSGSAPKERSSQIGSPLRPSGTSPACRGGFLLREICRRLALIFRRFGVILEILC